jgi:hypothetical protein
LKKLAILLLILFLGAPTIAQFNKVGRTSMQFLKIGIGARETALGEACIANVSGINSVFWNPAALTRTDNIEVGFHYTKWIADLNVMSAAAGINLGNIGVAAISYSYLNFGDLEEAFVTSPTGGVDTRTGRTFTGKDLVIGFALARAFTDKLSIGVNVKYLREDLFQYSTNLWSFDVGSFYDTGWRGIRLAMSAQNFSSQARWLQTGDEAQQSYELPLIYRIGVSIDLLGGEDLFLGGDPAAHRFSLNMDAIHSNDYAERLNLGLEYVFLNQFYLRGGYRINYDEGNIAMGVGVNTDLAGFKFQVDYSYSLYDFLDSPHRFSLLLSF